MATAARHRGGGFWRGLAVGFILAAALVGLAALIFPPARYLAPDVPSGIAVAPTKPWVPSAGDLGTGEPLPPPKAMLTPPRGGLLGNPAPAPLILARPAAEMAPGWSMRQAPDAFQGDSSGSPSLVPLRVP